LARTDGGVNMKDINFLVSENPFEKENDGKEIFVNKNDLNRLKNSTVVANQLNINQLKRKIEDVN
jgi:hypothetical protein